MTTSRTLENKSPLSRIPDWLATGLITVAVAFFASFIGVKSGVAVMDNRLTTAERSIVEVKEARAHDQDETIHRREFDASMKSVEDLLHVFKSDLDEIKLDVRELRNRQK